MNRYAHGTAGLLEALDLARFEPSNVEVPCRHHRGALMRILRVDPRGSYQTLERFN
jgi:hypothetical protein